MTAIFRVQDEDGRGPWRPGFSESWVESRPDHDNLPPWMMQFPFASTNLYSWERVGRGCLQPEQLKRWFTETEYKKLITLGYRAVEMKVFRIIDWSDIQCVFTRIKPLNEDVTEFGLYPQININQR